MKKTIFNSSALMALFAVSAIAHAAAPTAELKVTGEITAPTCTVVAPDDGTYDFGKISSTLIKPADTTVLTAKSKTWTVTCDADTYLSFSVVDQRAASASSTGNTAFGLGNVNGTGKIGYYTVEMKEPKVDGVAAKHFTAAAGSGSFYVYDSVYVTKGVHMGWASAANILKGGKVFVSELAVTPVLASSATMGGAVTDTVNLDGLITMNFVFGL